MKKTIKKRIGALLLSAVMFSGLVPSGFFGLTTIKVAAATMQSSYTAVSYKNNPAGESVTYTDILDISTLPEDNLTYTSIGTVTAPIEHNNNVSRTISTSDNVYWVNGDIGQIIVDPGVNTTLILDDAIVSSTYRTFRYEHNYSTGGGIEPAPLFLHPGATVTLVVLDGTDNTFICESYSTQDNRARNGIAVPPTANLIIQGQSGSSGTLTALSGAYGAGIGGASNHPSGNITIEGGVVTARARQRSDAFPSNPWPVGSSNGAGIGGGGTNSGNMPTNNATANIIIRGAANVTATSEGRGAGIGSGGSNQGIFANSGLTIDISGNAIVNATSGRGGAGIGGGGAGRATNPGTGNGTSVAAINISGNANVTAHSLISLVTTGASGNDAALGSHGAGIGGGGNIDRPAGNGGTITISGNAIVDAYAEGNGAGIGGGGGSQSTIAGASGNIIINSNTTVTATSDGNGAAIGGGGTGSTIGTAGAVNLITISGNPIIKATATLADSLDLGVGINGNGDFGIVSGLIKLEHGNVYAEKTSTVKNALDDTIYMMQFPNTTAGTPSQYQAYSPSSSASYPYNATSDSNGESYLWLAAGNQLIICLDEDDDAFLRSQLVFLTASTNEVALPIIPYYAPIDHYGYTLDWTSGNPMIEIAWDESSPLAPLTVYYEKTSAPLKLVAYDKDTGAPLEDSSGDPIVLEIADLLPVYVSYNYFNDVDALTTLVLAEFGTDYALSPLTSVMATVEILPLAAGSNEVKVLYTPMQAGKIKVEIRLGGISGDILMDYFIPASVDQPVVLDVTDTPDLTALGYELDESASVLHADAGETIKLIYNDTRFETTIRNNLDTSEAIVEKSLPGSTKLLTPPFKAGYYATQYSLTASPGTKLTIPDGGVTVNVATDITFYYEAIPTALTFFTTTIMTDIGGDVTITNVTRSGTTASLNPPHRNGYIVTGYSIHGDAANTNVPIANMPATGVPALLDTTVTFHYTVAPTSGGNGGNGGGGNTIIVRPLPEGNSNNGGNIVIDSTNVGSVTAGKSGATVHHLRTGKSTFLPEGVVFTLDEATPLGYRLIDLPHIDVNRGDWYFDSVAYAYLNGVMYATHTEPMKFSPNMSTSRAMIVTILYNLAGKPAAPACTFDDIPANTWYTNAVAWAQANNIVAGTGHNNFSPDAPVSRQDLSLILTRYANYAGLVLPETRESNVFADADATYAYAADAVDTLYKADVIGGKPGNIFDPRGNATRAEVTTMLHQFVQVTAHK